MIQATGGQGLDPSSMCTTLMQDKHFNNSKIFFVYMGLVLGDLLNKRPGAKKVEVFMAKQL